MDDSALIARYLDLGSEDAFTELVQRHYGLVFSAAHRRLGDATAAADTAQAVFGLLATRLRSLRGRSSIAGWLHQAALLKAREHLRAEARRRTREQQAAIMEPDNSTEESQAAWTQLAPLLDEAMAELRPDDREAILVRFFQNRSLREVGAALGLAEDAARKRVSRSIETLRIWFQRRGVAVPSAVLTAAIAAHATETVSPANVAAASRAALTAAATAPLSSLTQILLLMMSMKTGLIAVGVALAVLFVVHSRRPSGGDRTSVVPAAGAPAGGTISNSRPGSLRRSVDWVRATAANRTMDPALEAQLARLQAALFQPGEAAATEARKALEAIPLPLRGAALGLISEAMNRSELELCRRGVQLLPLVWPDGQSALPRLWELLATRGNESSDLSREILVSALQVAAYSSTVQELVAAALQGSENSRSSLEFQFPLLRSLVPQSDDTWRNSLLPFLYSPDAPQRLSAALALAQIPGAADPNTVSTLAQALGDSHSPGGPGGQLGRLLGALSAMGPNAASAVPALQQYAATHPEAADAVNLTLKAVSPAAWAGVGVPTPLPPADASSGELLRQVTSGVLSVSDLGARLDDPQSALAAARALAELGTNGAPAIPALSRALDLAVGSNPSAAYVFAATLERLDPTAPKPLVPFTDLAAGLTALHTAIQGNPDWESAITLAVQNSSFQGPITLSQIAGFAGALGRIDSSLRSAFVGGLLNADQRYQQALRVSP